MSDILADLQGVTKLNGNTYSSAEVLGMVVRASIEIERLRGLLREVMNHECAFPDDLERRIEAEINEQNVEEAK